MSTTPISVAVSVSELAAIAIMGAQVCCCTCPLPRYVAEIRAGVCSFVCVCACVCVAVVSVTSSGLFWRGYEEGERDALTMLYTCFTAPVGCCAKGVTCGRTLELLTPAIPERRRVLRF